VIFFVGPSGRQHRGLFIATVALLIAALVALVVRVVGSDDGVQDDGSGAVDIAARVGLRETTKTWGAVPFDYDRDGDADLLLGRHGHPATLFRNDDGHFSAVSAKAISFPHTDRHGCAAGDVNGDGRPDLYCAHGAQKGTVEKRNELWIQQADGSYVDRAGAYGVTDPLGRGRRPVFIDVNHDRFADIYVVNAAERSDNKPTPARLFLNVDGKRFRPAPEYGVDTTGSGGCVQAADVDGDGWQDLFVCGREKPAGIRIYRNEQGKGFSDVSAAMDVPTGGKSVARLADLDGDGVLDLVTLAKDELVVLLRTGGRFRRAFAMPLSDGGRVVAGDADGDGRLDLYVLQASADANPDDFILLNRGDGRDFTRVPVPAARGRADDVVPIDVDGDRRAEFVVLNGEGLKVKPGRVQVIAVPERR
jgi:hypothetical protein